MPELVRGGVRARCPGCDGAISTFEHSAGGKEFGSIIIAERHFYEGRQFARLLYVLLRCAGCGLGGVATLHDDGHWSTAVLEHFYPTVMQRLPLPVTVPPGIVAEFREAETCMDAGAYRAASAMFRSTLEKAFKQSGYDNGSLADKINEAVKDGVITEARSNRAHDDVRVLGNDVLHEEWRAVTAEEAELAHHYVQRILEDLYDDRSAVEVILRRVGRIP